MNTRRHFLKCCSTAVLGSTALPVLGAIAPRGLMGSAPPDFAAFTAQLNSEFEVVCESGSVLKVLLTRADLYQPSHNPGATSAENFNLHFTAAGNETLGEDTYVFRNPSLGEMRIFVVPHKNLSAGTDYVATFHGSAVTA